MKKIIAIISLVVGMAGISMAQNYSYEITMTTFNATAVSISSNTPTLLSLSPNQRIGLTVYSLSLFNISASSAVYTLSSSSTTSGVPVLTCDNGPIIGSGSETAPYIVTEKFEGLYLWAKMCGNSDVTMRRVIRGR